MAMLIKNITTYQKTKPAYDTYRKAKYKEQYRAALQAEYAKLQEQKEVLYTGYGKPKKQVGIYDVIKKNIDSILQIEQQDRKNTRLCESS